MFAKEVWETLSKIDVSEHVEVKGNGNYKLTYLSWAWAWDVFMKHFPQAEYEWGEVRYFGTPEGNTAEVSCSITIKNGENSLTRIMTLPVMDKASKTNASKIDPSSRDISDAKMRCLVKCIAMFGLGHYIYAGEDLPEGTVKTDAERVQRHWSAVKECFDTVAAIKEGVANGTLDDAVGYYYDLTEDQQSALALAPTKGGIWTTQEYATFKSNEWGEAKNRLFNRSAA